MEFTRLDFEISWEISFPFPFFLFFFFNFFVASQGLWDLSSPSGIAPGPLAVEAQNLNHWTARNIPHHCLLGAGDLLSSFMGAQIGKNSVQAELHPESLLYLT